jgi:multiple sugar transport system substrate-binding protein
VWKQEEHTMSTTRRQFLTLASVGAAGAGLALAGCSRGGGDGGDGGDAGGDGVNLAFTWWGNEVRNANTTAALAAYKEVAPDVAVEEQPGEWASYWDRLATQTAGNDAPDIIQMDMNYISEYGQRGALANLDDYGLDTSKFVEGTADSGVIDGQNFGVNAGINTPTVLINPSLFEDLGIDVPDDMTWTWDDWLTTATAISEASGGDVIGSSAFFSNDALLSAWLRQQGKSLFVEDGIGFDTDDIVAWLEYNQQFFDAGAIPSASQITEDASLSQDQSLFSTGKTAMAMWWSNQLEALEGSSGETLQILRFPSIDGDAMTRQAWYKASMLWSVSARSENPEAAVELINWWINDPASAEINLAERGVPANAEMAEHIQSQLTEPQQRITAFINDIVPELGETPIAPPAGGGNQLGALLLRYGSDMLFGNMSAEEAAQGFVDELSASITA